MDSVNQNPVLHIIVFGFHHKRGCQVEYAFPPLTPGGASESNDCPAEWKYLPSLAVPDGSHKFDEDTAFFHIPSLDDPNQTVFGISCFRQIPVEKVKNRTADMTRGTVQKSVCVLSLRPLYGKIQIKLDLVTRAYFDEGDFTKVSILQDFYHHLNSFLLETENVYEDPQLHVGLSVRDFILRFRRNALLLVKLLLLERRIIMYGSPAKPLCSTILSLLSLHPGMIERGLVQSACNRSSRPMPSLPNNSKINYENKNSQEKNAGDKGNDCNQPLPAPDCDSNINMQDDNSGDPLPKIVESKLNVTIQRNSISSASDKGEIMKRVAAFEEHPVPSCSARSVAAQEKNFDLAHDHREESTDAVDVTYQSTASESMKIPRDLSTDVLRSESRLAKIAQIDNSSCGVPLPVFTEGYLCLPYLSLQYLDVLEDANVHGYVVGTTNKLLKQKRKIGEIWAEIDEGRIESKNPDLKKILHLSTEDSRFMDYLLHYAADEKHDVFIDGVDREGSDEWIRCQFKNYLLCLLRTSLLPAGSKEIDSFNVAFMNAWRETRSYKQWLCRNHKRIFNLNPGYPLTDQHPVANVELSLIPRRMELDLFGKWAMKLASLMQKRIRKRNQKK